MARRGPAEAAPFDDERLSRVAQQVPVGFFEAGLQGMLQFASAHWCQLAAMEPAAALSRAWFETIHPDDLPRVRAAWEHASSRGAPLEIGYRVLRPTGTLALQTSLEPVTGAGGLLDYFAGATVDVTQMARTAEESAEHAEQFLLLTEITPQLIWVADGAGEIRYFNRPWIEYTSIDVAGMRSGGVKNIVHPDELGLTWERWNNALVTGEPYEIEYRLRNAATGAYHWFIGRAMPHRDASGKIVRWIGTATDIDAQKRSNDNLRFVLDAASALSANLTVDAVCATLANLAIERVADWCFVVLKDDDGRYDTRAIAHRDPQRVSKIRSVREKYPISAGSTLDRAIRRNTPILIPAIDDRELRAMAQDAEHLELLQQLGMHSAMLVPLSTDGGTVYGGIAFVSSESARPYTARDLEVAEMVAHRAAAAMHTAAAFQDERSRSQRLRFIAEAGELIVESPDLQSMLDRLTRFVVRGMADVAYVTLAGERDALRTAAVALADPAKAEIAARLRDQRILRPQAEESEIRLLSQHRTVLHKTVHLEAVLTATWEYLAADVRELDIGCAITVPLFARGETFGALVVCRSPGGKAYTEEDAELFTDVGRRLSMAIEHHRTLQRERRIAEALQQALLPQAGMLPRVDGLHFAAHYRPSTRESEVGGDWYDAVTLQDGSILISVGDVTGRGLHAAGLMGKLRQAIGMAALYERNPARILDAVDFHLRSRRSGSIATAFVGIIAPSRKTMRYAGAGHPPPLLRRNGTLYELRTSGLPLGLRDHEHVEQSEETPLDGAEMLILYTDGLTEATRDLSFGEERLAFLTSSDAIAFVRNPAEFLCDACLPPDAQDDTAVLAIGFGERTAWSFDAENAKAAQAARSEFVTYLRERAGEDADVAAAELVFGELVGNVVRHAPGPIEVQVEWNGARPVLHVIDRGRGFLRDPSLPSDVLSESGRGLYIVSQIAEALRIERIAGYGNHVAAVLRL